MWEEKEGLIWDHIAELRKTLLKSLVVIGCGFFLMIGFYQPLLRILTSSQSEYAENGLIKEKVERHLIRNHSTQSILFDLPKESRIESNLQPTVSNQYLLEPGQSLIYETVVRSPLLIMGPIEGLMLVFKVCFWLSTALTAPLWGWIWLQFVIPGLKTKERAILLPFLFLSIICLCLGIAVAFYVTVPLANQYLSSFNLSIGQNAWTLTHYLDYVLLLCLGHAIAAELALFLFMLVHFRLLSPDWLMRQRRYMYVLAFILGAVLTPPDVLTQLLLAFPLIGLYEIAILYARSRYQAETTLI